MQLGLEPLVRRHRVAHGQLRQPFQDQAVDLLGPLHQQVEARLGTGALEVGHALRQEAVGEPLGAGQPDGHVAQRAALADAGGDALGLQRRGVGVGGQLAAGLAQRHAARLALEQRDAQFVFQLGDLAAHGRGRHVLGGGRGGDRAAACHFQEISQAQRNHGKRPQTIA